MRMPIPPLEIAKSLGVPQADIAARLGVTSVWLWRLAKDPRHTRRVRVAELEAVLEQQRLELSLESLVRSRL
jgi:hypothetical protein